MTASRLPPTSPATPEESDGLLTIMLVKGDERYIWIYRPELWQATIREIGRSAADPELDLTWFDAAQLTHLVRSIAHAS